MTQPQPAEVKNKKEEEEKKEKKTGEKNPPFKHEQSDQHKPAEWLSKRLADTVPYKRLLLATQHLDNPTIDYILVIVIGHLSSCKGLKNKKERDIVFMGLAAVRCGLYKHTKSRSENQVCFSCRSY